MNEYWKNRLAQFDGVPIVDVFGVSMSDSGRGWSSLEQKSSSDRDGLGLTGFDMELWRVGDGKIEATLTHVTAILSYNQWGSLVGEGGYLRSHPVFHIKAKVAQNPAGFQEFLFVEWVGPASNDTELNHLFYQLRQPVTLDAPPLPPLQLSTYDGSWSGQISLPSWDGFDLQSEPNYGGKGTVFPLGIGSEPMPIVRLGYQGVPPSPEQAAAYVYLVENDKVVQNALLQAILDVYPEWQAEWGGDLEYMPDVNHVREFQSLLILWDLSILNDVKEGYAYVYFNLIPNWDVEHGLGAILHKDRVVAVDNHDSLYKVIERDIESN